MYKNIFLIRKRSLSEGIIFWGLLFIIYFGWFFQLFNSNFSTIYLEILFFLLSLSIYSKKKAYLNSNFKHILIVFLYFILSLFYSVLYYGANILDFLMIYKFLIYIILLLPFSNLNLLDKKDINFLFKLLIYMFFLVYTIKFFLGFKRPTLFIENNFEILLLCLFFYAHYLVNKSIHNGYILLLLYIAIISGSRSGVLLALVSALYVTNIKEIIKKRNLVLPILSFFGAIGVYFVFKNRTSDGLESTDRFRFYQHFLEAINDWSWWQFMLGAPRISKLSDYTCTQLSFYENLLSYDNDGSCYSVILHSFNMRVFYDHGLLVIFYLLFLLIYILRNRTVKDKSFVLLLLFINGLSVSSINSVYSVIGIAIISTLIISNDLNKNKL